MADDDNNSLFERPTQRRRRSKCKTCFEMHHRGDPCPPRALESDDEDVPPPLVEDDDDSDDEYHSITEIPPPEPIVPIPPLEAFRARDDDEDSEDPIQGIEDPLRDNQDDQGAAVNLQINWMDHNMMANPLRPNAAAADYRDRLFPLPPFTGPAAGAVRIPANCVKPVDYYRLFFDSTAAGDGIADWFLRTTNIYGRLYYGNRWEDASLEELYKFFALVTYGGLVKVPQFRDLWAKGNPYSSLYSRDIIRRTMTSIRFRELWRSLHFVDATALTDAERTARNAADGFWSVNPFCDRLSAKFDYYYNCGQFMDVDEMCIFFKGRHRCRVYNPMKPNKYHLKAFCLNCAKSGYTKRFYMYRGKDETRPAGVTATEYPVQKLCANAGFNHCGYIVGLDNWYTSLPLCIFMLTQLGIHVVGTVKTNRAGLPADGKFPYKGPLVRPRGTVAVKKAQVGPHTDQIVYLTAWQDSKPVHILSTFAPYASQTTRRASVNGRYARVDLPMLSIVAVYNSAMGGTDLCDQYSSYYEFEHRTTKWHRRILTHFSMVSLRNAHILYMTDPKNAVKAVPKSFRIFVEMVICETLGLPSPFFDPNAEASDDEEESYNSDHIPVDDSTDESDEEVYFENPEAPLAAPLPRPKQSRRWWLEREGSLRRLTGRDHWTIQQHKQTKVFNFVNGRREGSTRDARLCCYVCMRKASTCCASCMVTLCTYGENANKNCFYRFHNMDDFTHNP